MIPRLIFISVIGQIIPLLLLYWMLRRTTAKGSRARRMVTGVLLLEPVLFIVFLLLHLFAQTKEGLPYSLVPFSNMYIFMGYCITLYWIGEVALYLYRRIGGRSTHTDRHIRGWIFGSSAVLTLALCIWGYTNFDRPRVTHYDITLPDNGTPRKPIRLLLVTDIHIGEIITAKRVETLAKMIKEQHPDYVLVGGDMIDYHLKYAARPDVETAMDHLFKDKSKVFFVLGNHEYYADLQDKIKWLKPFGRLLIDEYTEIEPGLFLIGRDDYYNKDRAPLGEVMRGIPADAVTLLLSHTPITPKEVRANGIDLSMHGHTHSGQLFPGTVIVDMMYECAHGYYEKEGTHHVVSSGYGLSTSPLRIGSHSEIVVIDLTFDPSATKGL